MITGPRWWSQPFPPEGGQTADGIKRQLGRPGLDEYAVLVREAAQNSWDARTEGEVVEFRIAMRRLGDRAVSWRQQFGTGGTGAHGLHLLDRLHSGSWILTVSDRGTSGLGGPIRADEPVRPGEVADFVQFLRNVGEPRDKNLGGGTYGFGKGIFYRISEAGVIVVDTMNEEGDYRSRRLMGAALGAVDVGPDGRRLTGRHWWGDIRDGVPDPVLGERAAQIAELLGLPGFADGRTGTDVTIVLPSLDLDEVGSDVQSLAEKMRGYMYWHLWPKMVPVDGRPPMRFQIDIEGELLEFPAVADLPVLRDFATSLTTVRAGGGDEFTMPSHVRQYGRLGRLSLQFSFSDQTPAGPVWESVRSVAPIEAPYRHVARMRHAELIVDYFEGDPMPDPAVGYTGSFVTSESVDSFFSSAEPPTHDAWEVGALTGAARGIVQRSRTFLAEACRAQVEARSGVRSKAVQGLGRVASTLGALVQGAPGTRPVRRGTKPGGSGGRSGARVRTVRSSYVVIDEGHPFIESIIEVPASLPADAVVSAKAAVVVAGGRKEPDDDAPAGAMSSRIVGWWSADVPPREIAGSELAGAELTPGIWRVRAEALPDVSVTIDVAQGGRDD